MLHKFFISVNFLFSMGYLGSILQNNICDLITVAETEEPSSSCND